MYNDQEQENFSNNLNNMNIGDISDPFQIRYNDFASPDLSPPKAKQYYKLWLPPCLRWKCVKIRFARLHLLTLLDRNITKFELISSIVLAVLVATLGSIVIEKGFFKDLSSFLFCFVICSSQYTLLKSVQPDAASPTHGYNRIIIYSRPIYFSIGCTLILLSRYYLENNISLTFKLYRVNLFDPYLVSLLEEGVKVFILSFPIIFSFGLLPQINTFLMYFFEQIDIHIFGGTAFTMSLTSALYCTIRSLIVITLLYAFALSSLYDSHHYQDNYSSFTYQEFSVFFSVFCSILVFLAYFISRQSSDPNVLFNLIKKFIFCNQKGLKSDTGKSDKNEDKFALSESETVDKDYVDPLPQKLEKTLLTRLENDVILTILVTIVVFAIHVSTIFTLQPYVEIFLGTIATSLGFLLYYFFNHFRKELPWLFFASPIFKPREYGQFEVKGEAKIMWFEKLQAWLGFIEKNIIYPLLFLSVITKDTPLILREFGL